MLWKGFQKPKRLAVDTSTLTDKYGIFWAQPFERGFGTTVGNALRRVLLSSIEGAAVTAVKMEGVLHEFQSIPGVVEDATDIILNLKQIPFKLAGDAPKAIYLRADQPGVVTSGMIEADGDVEVLDKDVYIATVSEGGKLDMEMRLKRGRGYVSADKNFDEDLGIGFIPIDSVHSPVRKCNYTVEAARLGQITDYDKLTLEVWTNGSITPADSIGLAAKLLKDHMNIFINFEEEIETGTSGSDERKPEIHNENLNRSVEELELSVRSYNCLKNANIQRQTARWSFESRPSFPRPTLRYCWCCNLSKQKRAGLRRGIGRKATSSGRLAASVATQSRTTRPRISARVLR